MPPKYATQSVKVGPHVLQVSCRAEPDPLSSESTTDEPVGYVDRGEDSTGLDLWPASLGLANYLHTLAGHNLLTVPGDKIVELGAGTGVPGLMAALIGGGHVALTDFDADALELATQNVNANNLQARCTVHSLDFRSIPDLQPAQEQKCKDGEPRHLRALFSVALGADILYASAMVRPVLATAAYVLRPDGVLLLGHQPRFALILERTKSGEAQVEQKDNPWELLLDECSANGFYTRRLGTYHCDSNREPEDILLYAISRSQERLQAFPLL